MSQKINLEKFYLDPDWKIVEDILSDCLSTIATPPDESVEPADFKAQILANKKLLDAVSKFLIQSKISVNGRIEVKSKNPFE